MQIEWGHVAVEIAGGAVTSTVPILLYIASNKRTAKQENLKRHEENSRKLDDLTQEMNFLPLHGHIEKNGPLCAEGVIKKPNGKI